MFPTIRNRRLRTSQNLRDIISETQLSPNDFIAPVFAMEGSGKKEEISSMPDYYRFSLDLLQDEIKEIYSLGIKCVLLFVKVDETLKDNKGTESYNPNGLMQRAIKTIKKSIPDMVVMTDVALDPYSIYGHDGIVKDNKILNDETVDILCKMSISHAEAGADFVAPSDMMDGRIIRIRKALDSKNFKNISIMSYSAKYASCLYGPFRDALDSKPGFGDKKTYQMDFRNSKEAIKETLMDVDEGADIVMVKPAGMYLDIIKSVSENVDIPVSAYQVSGEYSMIKASAKKGWINEDEAILESLIAIKRAGANLIATYFAKKAAILLKK